MKKFLNPKILTLLIFILGLSLRIYGLNWDQGQHLHPDERFLTMVTADLRLPASISDYFNPAVSPLNPYNYPSYQFFVYGTFPVFLTKILAVILHQDGYDKVYLLGRGLSALFDSLNIILLYFLALKIFPKKVSPVWPPLFYAVLVLPLQLSHFYAVDTFLNFFLLLTFTFLVYDKLYLAALTFGTALACKLSAVIFIPIIGIFIIYYYIRFKKLFRLLLITVGCLLIVFFIFRVFQPYVFAGLLLPNPHFLDNLRELRLMSVPDGSFPPSVQWLSKTPLLFSFQNMALWGLGLPLTVIFLLSLLKIRLRKIPVLLGFALVWIILLYLYQGSQFVHTMRYFLPLYPAVCLVAGYFVSGLSPSLFRPLLIFHLVWALLFISVYSRPHSRIQASAWIYGHLPAGSRLTNETWDDPLPLYLPGRDPYIYHGTMLNLYDPDTPEKWAELSIELNNADYMIMTSNRLWGSIPKAPDRYPETAVFYQKLFAGRLGFSKLMEFNSYPGLNLPFLKQCIYLGPTDFPGVKNNWFTVDQKCLYPGIFIRDDIAEEAFTVYDHPKVLIFARIK